MWSSGLILARLGLSTPSTAGLRLTPGRWRPHPFGRGTFSVIAPPSTKIANASDLNQMYQIPVCGIVDDFLCAALESAAVNGGHCLIVEDNIRSLSNPATPYGSTSFIEGSIIHWLDLSDRSGEMAVNVIFASSTGYPLNAFVSTESSGALGLVDGTEAPSQLGAEIAQSLLAFVVTAFDEESYVIWEAR